MTETDEPDQGGTPQQPHAASPSPADLAQALEEVKSSSPELAASLDAANVNPDDLADAHQRATSGEQDSESG